MMVKIMSNSKRIKEKVHFSVSGLAGAVQFFAFSFKFLVAFWKLIFMLTTIHYLTNINTS